MLISAQDAAYEHYGIHYLLYVNFSYRVYRSVINRRQTVKKSHYDPWPDVTKV